MGRSATAKNLDYEVALVRLTTLARARIPRPVPEGEGRSIGFDRVQARLAGPLRPSSAWRLAFPLGLVGALAATAVLLVVDRGRPEAPLAAAVEGAAIAPGDEVRAPEDGERSLRFSDGTQVVLARASRTRLDSVSARGARVRLQSGRAKVHVVHRQKGNWLFNAGPCEVQVTGTTFDMNWSEDKQRLEVDLHAGSVTVRGPAAPSVVTLKAGQRLVMDLRQGVSVVERIEGGGSAAAAPAPATAPAPAEAPPAGRADRPAPTVRRSWTALAQENEFAAILEEARRTGIDSVLGRASSSDLLALADAARLTGDTALARRSMLAVRARFKDSPQAVRAAYLLGTMAEDVEGDSGKAIEWYGAYLARSPRGVFVSDALGRKMTATQRLHGTDAARPLAEEYLRRFPDGAYADAARTIAKTVGR